MDLWMEVVNQLGNYATEFEIRFRLFFPVRLENQYTLFLLSDLESACVYIYIYIYILLLRRFVGFRHQAGFRIIIFLSAGFRLWRINLHILYADILWS